METRLVGEQIRPAHHIRSRSKRLERVAITAATYGTLLVLLVSALHWIAPQRNGIATLSQIFAPYLFLALVPLMPLLFFKSARTLRVAMTACAIIFIVRFGPDLISFRPAPTPNGTTVVVLSWNTYVDNRQFMNITRTLGVSPAGVVALQELTMAQSNAIRDDIELRRRYPWQIHEAGGANGMGFLSSYPILEQGQLNNPHVPDAFPTLWARLDLGEGRTLLVVNAHPRPGNIGLLEAVPIPTQFEPSRRDAEIRYIHEFIAPKLAQGEPLLLMGDFNVTDREPAYPELIAGLQDTHAAVGIGPGHTWRHARVMHYGFGLLRIDYLLASPQLRPLSTTVDCTPRGGDHCILQGVFEFQQP